MHAIFDDLNSSHSVTDHHTIQSFPRTINNQGSIVVLSLSLVSSFYTVSLQISCDEHSSWRSLYPRL